MFFEPIYVTSSIFQNFFDSTIFFWFYKTWQKLIIVEKIYWEYTNL